MEMHSGMVLDSKLRSGAWLESTGQGRGMRMRRVFETRYLPTRFAALSAVWVLSMLMLGTSMGVPLPVFVITSISVLLLAFVYARQHDSELARGGSRMNVYAPADPLEGDDDPSLDDVFADHFVAKEFAAARRGRNVTLVMFGFSRFEEFSHQQGYAAAANALREFGKLLQRLTRQMNLTARYGWRADSFLSVLSDADADAAEVFINRVRDAAKSSRVRMPDIEAGVAVYQPHMTGPEEFVECAKQALDAARATRASAEATVVQGHASVRVGHVPSRRIAVL
jgi:diguanylate cyclase (GGDEF)-like protein